MSYSNLKRLTVEEVESIWRENMEDTKSPIAMAIWIGQNEGKCIRKPNIPEGYRIEKDKYRGTMLVGMQPGTKWDYHKLEYYKVSETMEPVERYPSVAEFREMNPSYYAGRDKRNDNRRSYLTTERAKAIVDRFNAAIDAIKAVRDGHDDDTDYYALREAAGMGSLPYGPYGE